MPPKTKTGKRKAVDHEEQADVDRIINERTTRGNKKQYLCTWMDGAPAQWVDAKHLKDSPAEQEWEYAASDDEEEVYEPENVVKEKCATLKQWLHEAKRPVFFLGAGISAPVLPTFRGKGGLWTRNPKNQQDGPAQVQPTRAHHGLTELERQGHVYWCVTQNYDDLSRRAGFPTEKLSELHGNIFVESCDQCGKSYHRDFEVVKEDSENHETGRRCESCRGILRDNIVHFDELIPALAVANAKSVGADLSIVLGSSLKVYPAARLPFQAKKRSRGVVAKPKAVIVNLQPTPMDEEADLIIRATCDQVIQLLLE